MLGTARQDIPPLKKPDRLKAVITGRMRKTVSTCVEQYQMGAVGIEKGLDTWGNHMPHNIIRRITRESGLATGHAEIYIDGKIIDTG